MAIDFSQVKTITIPEGSVTKITDSTGNILWQGIQSKGWHTIWEGSKTCQATDHDYSGRADNFAHTVSGTGYTPKIRITFSITVVDSPSSPSNKGKIEYYINNKSGTAAPKSPLIINALKEQALTITVLGGYIFYENYNYKIFAALWADKDTSNNRISFDLMTGFEQPSSSSYKGKATLTITKIEQYY